MIAIFPLLLYNGGEKEGLALQWISRDKNADELLPAAIEVVLETGQTSVSILQRRLKLGYSRAARLIDKMEERGIIGPFNGDIPRTILVSKEQLSSMVEAPYDEDNEGDTPVLIENMDGHRFEHFVAD